MKLKFKEISFLELGLNKNIRTGAGFNSSDFIDEGIPLIKIGNIKNNVIDLNDCSFVSAKYKTDAVVKEKDLLIAMRGATSGKLGLVSKESEGYYYVGSIGNLGPINEKLIYFPFLKYLEEQLFEILKTKSKGTATPMVSIGMLKEFKLLIPESKDQQKYLYDVLELRKDKSNLIRKELTHQLSLIKQMRQAFLREAMQGRFEFPQQPLTEALEGNGLQTGQQLLTKIKVEKAQLIKTKKLKAGLASSQSINLIDDYVIPNNWTWCKADEIFFITKLAGFEYSKNIRLMPSGEIPVIRAQNVRPLEIKKTNLLYIDRQTSLLLDRCALTKKCLLVTFIGAGIGDVSTFNEKERWHLAPNVAKLEPFFGCEDLLNVKFINFFLMSDIGQIEIFKHVKATAQPSLSMGTLRDIDIPIPSKLEQEQIVAKLEELMAFCDGLEQSIKESQGYNEMLLQQVLREALQGEAIAV